VFILDYIDIIASIVGAWVVTRIVYIIINFRLNPKQEAAIGFVVTFIIALLLGKWEYFIGGIIWFVLDVTGVTNNFERAKNKKSNIQT
jgi:hypothetical protein